MIDDADPDDSPDDPLPTEQPTVDAGDIVSHRKRTRRIDREEREAADFWAAVLGTEVGRREIWKLLTEQFHTFNPAFGLGPSGFPQAELTWFNAGVQNAGQVLYHKLAAVDRLGILTMHDENDPRYAKRKP